MPCRLVVPVAALLAVATADANAQVADTLIVEVRIEGVGSAWALATDGPDSTTIRFSAREIFDFVEMVAPANPMLSLQALRDELRVDVFWLPSRMLLLIRDPNRALPVSRNQLDELRAQSRARAAVPVELRGRGPFLALTMDEAEERLVEAGYSLGRLVGRWSHSTVSGQQWAVNANVDSRLWLSYRDSERDEPALGARLALGRTWITADYDLDNLELAGATSIGPLVVYATTQDRAVVTWRGPVQLQAGYTGDRGVVRVAWGPVPLSPFSMPWVR